MRLQYRPHSLIPHPDRICDAYAGHPRPQMRPVRGAPTLTPHMRRICQPGAHPGGFFADSHMRRICDSQVCAADRGRAHTHMRRICVPHGSRRTNGPRRRPLTRDSSQTRICDAYATHRCAWRTVEGHTRICDAYAYPMGPGAPMGPAGGRSHGILRRSHMRRICVVP